MPHPHSAIPVSIPHLFQWRPLPPLRQPRFQRELLGSPAAPQDVLALGVAQPLAVDVGEAAGGVAAEDHLGMEENRLEMADIWIEKMDFMVFLWWFHGAFMVFMVTFMVIPWCVCNYVYICYIECKHGFPMRFEMVYVDFPWVLSWWSEWIMGKLGDDVTRTPWWIVT